MKNKPSLFLTVAAAVLLNQPCWAQPQYTPFSQPSYPSNNNYSGTPNTQRQGAGDGSAYQNPGNAIQGKPNTAIDPNNYSSYAGSPYNKHSKQKVSKNKGSTAGVGSVDSAPTKAAKAGVGLTDRTAKSGVGLTDRAAKVGVGVPLKAVKETFKAIF